MNWQALALVLMGAVAGGIVSGLGYVLRRTGERSASQANLNAGEATRLALLERDVSDLKGQMADSRRHRGALSEELSTVAAILDRHEAWHARHDPGSTRGPG